MSNHRYGRNHVHDMGDHFLLHRDWYDPKKNPIKHFFGEAQKLNMIVGISLYILVSIYALLNLRKRSPSKNPNCVKRFVIYILIINSVFMLFINYQI